MVLRIAAATESDVAALRELNARLRAGGSTWSFYESHEPDWLAPDGNAFPRRTHFVARDDRAVRGAYVLKEEIFLLDGRETLVGNVQGPVSEGLISKRFGIVGGLLIKDSLQRAPLQIGWGTSKQKAAVLEGSGWAAHQFPLLLRVERQRRFLRENRILGGASVRNLQKIFAQLGLPPLGMKIIWAALAARRPSLKDIQVLEESAFGDWADDIWRQAAPQYRLIAKRDADSLGRVLPTAKWPNARILRIARNGASIGWAAYRDRQLSDDAHLGDLRAGSIIDALALPGEEDVVAAAAARHLERLGVEVTGAIFSHPRWVRAFRTAGFVAIPKRRYFAMSPELLQRIALSELIAGGHLSLTDGDGPRMF